MVYTALAAGGIGRRMGAAVPKHFLEINGKPIIIITAEKFYDLSDKLFVGVTEDRKVYTKALFEKFNLSEKTEVVAGGGNRMETIYNILNEIEAKCSVTDNDIVITHDAVRPFVSKEIIIENINLCEKYSAAGTFVKTVDTICTSQSGGFVSSVPERSSLYNVQTPQTVNFKLLKNILEKHISDFEKYTDLCGLLCSEGIKTAMVRGEYSNIKITTPSDLKFAEGFTEKNKKEGL